MTRLYQTMCRYVDVRQAAETPTSDAIDLLLKEGVEKDDIVSVSRLSSMCAFRNSLIGTVRAHRHLRWKCKYGNTSWILLYLGFDQEWKSKITTEIQALITNYAGDYSTDSVYKQLTTIPLSAWEDEMPMTDAVLRETLRLTVNGVPLRRNLDKDIHILGGTTNIPRGSFLVYPIWDTHLNPEIYDNPREFDPARFGPGREEDKKATLSFLGWGAGRHPCPGMKVAKLEVKMIVAFLIHAFEFNVVDATGNPVYSIPQPDYNDIYHTRPLDPCFVKYRRIRQ
ncbi:hypothetical protein H0H93_007184 [Arthromyces matolae]|nr:hypothetical protein H0H93_007184 [Arthromyces matolae]